MGMIGLITTDSGVPLNYHNIYATTLFKNGSINITLNSFYDKASRLAINKAVLTSNLTLQEFQGDLNIPNVYTFLMTTDNFKQMVADL